MIRYQLGLFPGYPAEGAWDFTGEDTQYLTHGLHPYLASMIPQVARKLLAMYAQPTTRVLDPFVGGGSVLVESYLANLLSAGIDINPLAVMISRAKTTPIPSEVLTAAWRAFERIYPKTPPDFPDFPASARIHYWFKPYMFEPLAKIRTAIGEVAAQVGGEHRESLENLLLCVFSNTVRDVSLTYRGEIRLRRLQGKDLEQFNPDVLDEFRLRLRDAFFRVVKLPPANVKPCVYEGDSRHIEAESGAYDLVITSPPYGDIKNTIPYDQFSKNMLYWLGMGEAAVNRIRNGALGAKKDRHRGIPPSETLHTAVAQIRKPNLLREAMAFYADYYDALTEIARVTSQRIVIVIGHRILGGVLFDNPTITTELMREIGWNLEARFERRIRKKRLNRKMGFGNNAQGATIDTEAILVYTAGWRRLWAVTIASQS